ncbi:hypothetical protein MPL1032_50163 [Mesorhizobium plurifarium]|uniref:Uncharacterized protein n=1 Tax=Mesorhizobium plurifarium TaxID=69974 RepID=A0A0K2W5G1_MESPL|nr:hypothetical protein MPL1032_50163 [Mesorhizobium plurifarium]
MAEPEDFQGSRRRLSRLVDDHQLVRLEACMLRGPDVAFAVEPVTQIHAGSRAVADCHFRASGFQPDDVSGLETIGHFDLPC